MMMLQQQQNKQRIRLNLIVNGYIVISYLLLYMYVYEKTARTTTTNGKETMRNS